MRTTWRRWLAVGALAPLAATATILSPTTARAERGGGGELEGRTTVTTSPAVTRALLGAGIVPEPIRPARERVGAGPVVRATFPITGGSLHGLSGDIMHSGGLTFVNRGNGHRVAISGFDIVLDAAPHITAYVPALHTRATVFTLDLGTARVRTSEERVDVANVGVALAPGVASILDGALGTSVFTDRLRLGSAEVVVSTDD